MNIKKELDDKEVIASLNKLKDKVMFILLAIFILIPALKQLNLRYFVVYEHKIVLIIGILGFYFLIFYQILNYKQSKDKKEYLKEMIPIILLAVYMIWTLISCVFSENKVLAFLGLNWRHEGYLTYIAYAGFFALAFYIKSTKLKKILLNLFLIISLFISITVQIEENLKLNFFWANNSKRAVFYNLNHYGYYLLLSLIVSNALFVTEKNKILKTVYMLLYMYFIYALIGNNTFGCYIAGFATLIIFMIFAFIKKEKRTIAILSVIIYIIMSNIPQIKITKNVSDNFEVLSDDLYMMFSHDPDAEWQKAGSSRMTLWVNGLELFTKKPILGYGVENVGIKYKELGLRNERPHNIIIQQLTTSGLIGAFLYFTGIVIIAIRSFKKLKIENTFHLCAHFACCAYLISAMFGVSIFYTSPYFFIFLGLAFYETEKERSNERIKIG